MNAPPCAAYPLSLFIGPCGERPHVRVRRERRAVAVCTHCSPRCREACLLFALEVDDREAVLGGTTPAQRRAVARVA